MKTIAIVASPRRKGNCDLLVDNIIDKLGGNIEKYFLKHLDIQFCNACQTCQKGDCIKDDDARRIIDEMQEADLVIFAYPIYYGQMSAQAKTLIDRFYQISQNPNKTLEGTKVIQIVTQANPGDTYDGYIESMKTMPFGFMGMEVIETIIARGASSKGEGIEDALNQINELEI